MSISFLFYFRGKNVFIFKIYADLIGDAMVTVPRAMEPSAPSECLLRQSEEIQGRLFIEKVVTKCNDKSKEGTTITIYFRKLLSTNIILFFCEINILSLIIKVYRVSVKFKKRNSEGPSSSHMANSSFCLPLESRLC